MIITERGTVRNLGRVTLDNTTTRVRQTSSLFTVAQDGGEGRLSVATEVPSSQVAALYDYTTAHGYLTAGVVFRQVGTSLVVRPVILPNGSIRVRVTPHITYLTATGGGEVEFAEATTQLIVPNGAPVSLGGAVQQLHALTRQLLGYRAAQAGRDVSMVLIASVQ